MTIAGSSSIWKKIEESSDIVNDEYLRISQSIIRRLQDGIQNKYSLTQLMFIYFTEDKGKIRNIY